MPRSKSIHERLNLREWIKRFPLAELTKKAFFLPGALTGPAPIAYIEQIRTSVKKAGGKLGKPIPVDLCVWNLGEPKSREVTKIGGVPYWPIDEPWPEDSNGRPLIFVAQFCFADSRDIVRKVPGDIMLIFAVNSDDRPLLDRLWLTWIDLGADLLPARKMPARSPFQPCYAALHRTEEYPRANYELSDAYPYPLCMWAKVFRAGSKIGGAWEPRGEVASSSARFRKWEKECKRTFICQLGSMQAEQQQPFLNLRRSRGPGKDRRELLMIGDVGGIDLFDDGKETTQMSWSG